ncbi:unnamed protein product [Urochloa decumbens]|uniref:Retrovirus-related Pol polyprotein from transposon TNT 1-94-like beta-barrel domain-containing protein n=1 Tax=Urochloa decumbens TaxID=240449 RepID=A0ABC9GU14_9POAL
MPCSSAAPPPPECRDAAADASPARGEHANPPPPAAAPMPAAHDGSKEARPSGVILDSGAAASATGSADHLSDLKAAPGGEAFRTRAGTHLPVAAVGTLATASFRIADVRHVPGLRRTVVSVRQLTRQGLAVNFGAESCSVKDPTTGTVVGEGRLQEEDGFYHLQYLRVPQS